MAEDAAWEALRILVEPFSLTLNSNSISWELEASSIFSVKSSYAQIGARAQERFAKALWATRVPLKVRIFSWQESFDRLPSTLNPKKHHGSGNGCHALCGSPEDSNHFPFSMCFL